VQKWEYLVDILYPASDKEGVAGGRDPVVRRYLQETYQGAPPGKYNPKYLEAALCNFGDDGWELVSIEPVCMTGREFDWRHAAGGQYEHWTQQYWVVFRRQKSQSLEIQA